jgi:hypothetical protein
MSKPLYSFILIDPASKPKYSEVELNRRLEKWLKARRFRYPSLDELQRVLDQRKEALLSHQTETDAETRVVEAYLADLYPFPPLWPSEVRLDHDAMQRIRRRAKCLASVSVPAGKPFENLRKEEREQLERVKEGLPAAMPGDEAWADQIAADLHADMPWLSAATEWAWHVLRRAARRDEPIKLPPVILNGPIGIGKSLWARRLAERLDLPWADIDASKGGAGFSLTGIERGWSSAQPGRPLELILERRLINPLIVVDELDKASAMTSSKGARYVFADGLLSLLEPSSSRRWECPTLRQPFDMSRISWILTANTTATIPPAVLNRCEIIDLPDLTRNDLIAFAQRRGAAMDLGDTVIEVVVEAIEQASRQPRRRLSLRDVNRMLERAEALENRPLLN